MENYEKMISWADKFGTAGAISIGGLHVALSKNDLGFLKSKNKVTIEGMPGISLSPVDNEIYRYASSVGTGYVYHINFKTREFISHNGNIIKKDIPEKDEFFKDYIDLCNLIRSEYIQMRKAFGKKIVKEAKELGFFKKGASVSAMALTVAWYKKGLPLLTQATAKKIQKYEAWSHILNLLKENGRSFIDNSYSCFINIEALSLYTYKEKGGFIYKDEASLNPLQEALDRN